MTAADYEPDEGEGLPAWIRQQISNASLPTTESPTTASEPRPVRRRRMIVPEPDEEIEDTTTTTACSSEPRRAVMMRTRNEELSTAEISHLIQHGTIEEETIEIPDGALTDEDETVREETLPTPSTALPPTPSAIERPLSSKPCHCKKAGCRTTGARCSCVYAGTRCIRTRTDGQRPCSCGEACKGNTLQRPVRTTAAHSESAAAEHNLRLVPEGESTRRTEIPFTGPEPGPTAEIRRKYAQGITPLEAFTELLGDSEEALLTMMNKRRADRVQQRRDGLLSEDSEQDESERSRGRPPSTTGTSSSQRRTSKKKYADRWTRDFTRVEFLTFLAMVLMMGLYHQSPLSSHWTDHADINGGTGNAFIRVRMTQDRFEEMFRCFNLSNDEEFFESARQQMRSVWNPSRALSTDESMVPTQHRRNPHHVFIARKPHRHGIVRTLFH